MTTRAPEASAAQNAPAAAHTSLRIVVGGPARQDADVILPVSPTSCWTRLLGAYDLPADNTIDTLAAMMQSRVVPPADVVLIGAPAQCLLPLLWLRTIWLGPDARIVLRWERVGRPGADMREQLAARLCCALANAVECADEAHAQAFWGVDADDNRPLADEAFDMLLGLVDSWDIAARNGPITDPDEWLLRARAALCECADRGETRVALYGAGTHTRALGPLLMSPPVEIICIIDDDEKRHAERMWGFPIVSRQRAIELGVHAVVLSANAFEPRLVENAAILERSGARVVRLYPEVQPA